MHDVNCFLMGEMSLEDAMLSTRGSDPVRVFVTWRDGDMILGIQERDAAPVFTRIPVGLGAGLGVATGHVFQALDHMPPREVRGASQQVFSSFPKALLGPEARPGLVSALTALAKEAMSHADR